MPIELCALNVKSKQFSNTTLVLASRSSFPFDAEMALGGVDCEGCGAEYTMRNTATVKIKLTKV